MPPAGVRRPLTVTTWLLLGGTVILASPVLLGVTGLIAALTGDRRALVFVRMLVAYAAAELATLAALGALWLVGARGRTRPHWLLLRWFVARLAGQAAAAADISVVSEPSEAAESALREDGPLLVFSRHAGPGDTLLLAYRLLCDYDRHPSVVFKQALELDPCIDLLSHRLPHAVLDTSDRDECEIEITRVSRELGRRGLLMLFPEGGNFTEDRRRSALAKLRRGGRDRAAAQAERMPHVLPPHPTGVQCALAANPDADVIFAAHTGLGLAASVGALWREMPIGGTLRTRMWLVPAAEVPDDADAQAEWLFDWWKRIEDWVASAERG